MAKHKAYTKKDDEAIKMLSDRGLKDYEIGAIIDRSGSGIQMRRAALGIYKRKPYQKKAVQKPKKFSERLQEEVIKQGEQTTLKLHPGGKNEPPIITHYPIEFQSLDDIASKKSVRKLFAEVENLKKERADVDKLLRAIPPPPKPENPEKQIGLIRRFFKFIY